jgi:hypothetical protein
LAPAALPGGGVVFTLREGDKAFLWRAADDGSERRQLVAQGLYNFGA